MNKVSDIFLKSKTYSAPEISVYHLISEGVLCDSQNDISFDPVEDLFEEDGQGKWS